MLTIEAKGNFTKKVEDGAYINLTVKYGIIQLINQKADLCEQMKNVDEECPLEGAKTVLKDVQLPKEIPPVCKSESRLSKPTNGFAGKVHGARRRLYFRRRTDYLLAG